VALLSGIMVIGTLLPFRGYDVLGRCGLTR
jgi:hypothetical protein